MERFLDGAGEATESTDDTVKVEECRIAVSKLWLRSFPWFMAATVSTQPVERELCRAGLRRGGSADGAIPGRGGRGNRIDG
jgi:hypothetical protein